MVKPHLLTFILVLARPRNCGTCCVDQGWVFVCVWGAFVWVGVCVGVGVGVI